MCFFACDFHDNLPNRHSFLLNCRQGHTYETAKLIDCRSRRRDHFHSRGKPRRFAFTLYARTNPWIPSTRRCVPVFWRSTILSLDVAESKCREHCFATVSQRVRRRCRRSKLVRQQTTGRIDAVVASGPDISSAAEISRKFLSSPIDLSIESAIRYGEMRIRKEEKKMENGTAGFIRNIIRFCRSMWRQDTKRKTKGGKKKRDVRGLSHSFLLLIDWEILRSFNRYSLCDRSGIVSLCKVVLGDTFRTGICGNNNVEQRVVFLIAENTTEERTEPATPAQPLTNVGSETAHYDADFI
ncbi:hypothetical protein E2986_12926 [Frieseomelitta varia]|uniref:Uncharacterized protein n=1 Tax=Frieseomelitta varia TaxID=561572 RepID=A0A833RSU3_9HYME|nr:hypothetical protein E2986_12926 [Frieseomelitta varia]